MNIGFPPFIQPNIYQEIEKLKQEINYLKQKIQELENSNKYIDYGFLYETRIKMLKKAFSNFDCTSKEFVRFAKNKDFLNYAIFMAKKESSNFIKFFFIHRYV